jgi:hypothetical protein
MYCDPHCEKPRTELGLKIVPAGAMTATTDPVRFNSVIEPSIFRTKHSS